MEECTFEDCKKAHLQFVQLMNSDAVEKIVKHDLECWYVQEGHNVTGQQYKISYSESSVNEDGQMMRKTKYFRPKLYRMWFYREPFIAQKLEDHDNYTVSHLCHHSNCCNPAHLILEDLAVNKSRNVCPGDSKCWHKPLCLRPGHQLNDEVELVVWDPGVKRMIWIQKDEL